MKKIFIDCGTHLFEGFSEFVEMYSIDDSWICYSFEANPFTYAESKPIYNELINSGYSIKHYNLAVSDRTDRVKVNCDGSDSNNTGLGSNILTSRPEVDIQYGNSFKYYNGDIFVDSIDLSSFIKTVAKEEDLVVIKLDVEGAEFAILDKIILDKSYILLDDLYCEFHERFFDDIEYYKTLKISYLDFLKNHGVLTTEWK